MRPVLSFFSLQLLVFSVLSLLPKVAAAQCGSLVASVSPTESRCAATGSIIVNASGGVAPETYQYSITAGPVTVPFSSLNTISGLPPGTYTVVIKDVTANCTITDSNIVVPGNYVAPGILYNSTAPTCMNGNDGTIFVTGQTGGRAPFSYQIISPSPSQVGTVSATGSFSGLIPGLYYIQMTDSCGGIQTRSQIVTNTTWSILNSSNVTNNCQNITANIFLTNSNGINSPNAVYAGFQYGISLFPGDTTWFSSTPFSFNIGLYRSATIVVKDNCGNVQSFPWTEQIPRVNATISVSNQTCTTFTATVTGQNNLNPSFTQYCLYDQTDSMLLSACQSSPEFDSLPYGTYTIRINESCFDTTIIRTVTASKPLPTINNNPQYSYSCVSFSATITGQTDTSNATYCLYQNGNPIPDTCNTTGIFINLTYDTSYCIKLHNAATCADTIITRCFTIGKQQPSVSASVNISNATCTTFTATVTGQTNINNPIYRLFNGANNIQIGPDQTSPVFDSLPYGSYCIHIINDSTCYDTTIVRCFTQAAQGINISLSSHGTCSLIGGTNVKVNFISGIAPFTSMIYAPDGTLLNTATSSGNSYTFNSMPGLPTGELYKVVVTDSCGHQDSGTVASNVYFFNRNITVTPRCPSGTSPNGTSDVTIVVTENRGGTFTTTIIKKDGVAFNQNPGTTVNSGNTHTFTFTSLLPGTYIFSTYSQSCNVHVYDTVIVTSYIYPSLAYTTGYICDDSSQSINVTTTGGLGPFQYEIFGSVPAMPSITTPYQTSPVFVINNGTPYTLIRLRVLDACVNASINDVGFESVATPAINATSLCPVKPTLLWIDPVANATYLWYKRTYNPTDSVLIDSGASHSIPSLTLADTGIYIAKTIINSGCEVRVSYFNLISDSMACSVLPVKLERFTAQAIMDHSLLNWTTSNELNVKDFTIERSVDNGKTWLPLGEVLASGKSSATTSYSFTDNNPQNGINSYRLQIHDNNGITTYSSIKQINIQSESSMTIFPNPIGTQQAFNVELSGLKAGAYKISMVSSSGQTLKEMTFTITNSGAALLVMPSVNIAAGSYQVNVSGNNQQYSKPIVITNR